MQRLIDHISTEGYQFEGHFIRLGQRLKLTHFSGTGKFNLEDGKLSFEGTYRRNGRFTRSHRIVVNCASLRHGGIKIEATSAPGGRLSGHLCPETGMSFDLLLTGSSGRATAGYLDLIGRRAFKLRGLIAHSSKPWSFELTAAPVGGSESLANVAEFPIAQASVRRTSAA
jgi:hypothetical protein